MRLISLLIFIEGISGAGVLLGIRYSQIFSFKLKFLEMLTDVFRLNSNYTSDFFEMIKKNMQFLVLVKSS